MKKWFFVQLTEPTAWIGALLIAVAFFVPRWFIVLLGAVIIALDEDACKGYCVKRAPKIAAWIEKIKL